MCETLLSPTIRRASYSARLPEVCPAHAYITIAGITHTNRFSLSLTPYKLQVASLLQARVAYHWTDNCFPSSTVGSSWGDQASAWSCLQLFCSPKSPRSPNTPQCMAHFLTALLIDHPIRAATELVDLYAAISSICAGIVDCEGRCHTVQWGLDPSSCGRAKRLCALRREPSPEHS